MSRFVKDTALTTVANIISIAVGLGTSIIIARTLGPEGKGIFSLVTLVPVLIVTIINLGVGPTTVAVVAQGRYPLREILGNNILLAIGIGIVGLFIGLTMTFLLQESVFFGVAQNYLFLSLALTPMYLFFSYLQNMLVGTKEFKKYNSLTILQALATFAFVVVAVWAMDLEIMGAISATLAAAFLTNILLFYWTNKIAGGISFRANRAYLKKISSFGAQINFGGILGFLNYRIDMFIISGFLNPVAVGFYSISVTFAERLWLISQAASTVLLQRVAAETDEQARKELTPLVARTTLWLTALGALLMFFVGPWLVSLLYSLQFLPAVKPLQILLPGIVALSVCRLLANDLAAREKPTPNTYATGVALLVSVILNVLWIPKYGIEGAAWASTISYCVALVIVLFIYCRLTGNSWSNVLLPQRSDWPHYRHAGLALRQWVRTKTKI